MIWMRMHWDFLARPDADIHDSDLLVVQNHFVMLGIHLHWVLSLCDRESKDRHANNGNECFHSELLPWF